MNGHASPEELNFVEEMGKDLSAKTASVEILFLLGRLYHEPLHREEEAITLLETLLTKEPRHKWAMYWLAHLYAFHVMDETSLKKAMTLAESIIDAYPQESGAAYEILAHVRKDMGELSKEEYASLLEESVRLEPEWVNNRICLAEALASLGKNTDAVEQLRRAMRNLLQWRTTVLDFEETVTGRAGDGKLDEIKEMLDRLGGVDNK